MAGSKIWNELLFFGFAPNGPSASSSTKNENIIQGDKSFLSQQN